MNVTTVKNNIAALFALQTANYIIPLITIPYLVRVLGPDNFGRIAFAQAFIQYFVVLTDYGFNLSATRVVAQIRHDQKNLSRLVSAVMITKTALMAVGLVIMLGIVWLIPAWRTDWILYSLVYLTVIGGVLLPVWLFQGIERMKYITIFSVTARIVVVLSIFLSVHEASDYRLAAALQAGGTVISGVLALIFLPRIVSLDWHWPGIAEIQRVARDGWHMFMSTAAVNLYTSSNVFFLGLLTNPSLVGYFAAAEKLLKATHGLVGPVSQAVYPYIAALVGRSKEAALEFIATLLRVQAIATLGLSFAIFVSAEFLVIMLFGDSFHPSIILVQWMAALPFVVGLSNIFGIQTMLNFKMEKTFSHILLASGLINIALIFTLVPIFEAEGAAISVLLTEIAVTSIMAKTLANRGLLQFIVRGVHIP